MRDEACEVAEITTAQAISLDMVAQQVHAQEENSPVVGFWPDGLLMAEEPSMRIRGVDHVEVTPDERAVWWRERKLRILTLCMDVSMGMAVASAEPAVCAGDGEPDEREQGKEHSGKGTSPGNPGLCVGGV